MSSLGSNDDCYYYYYSSCAKGDDCPFRHCKAALGTETVCVSWREGRCRRDNCKFRHMESRINRSYVPCYWENQPSGCLKPHCLFFHRKPRPTVKPNAENEKLILPLSTNTPDTSPSDFDVAPVSIPIEPIVFSFDSEESDSESSDSEASSSPIKPTSNDSESNFASAMKNLTNDLSNKNDFLMKRYEQLKLEKILKESDNFYEYDYDVPLMAPSQSKMKNLKAEFYSQGNLRNKLLKRRNMPAYSEKLVSSMKETLKKKHDLSSYSTPDLKIKTLEEIRREKQNKLADNSTDNQKEERQRMILHEVQNITDDQKKADTKGKRKYTLSQCTDEKRPKQLKFNNCKSSKNILGVAESEEKQVKCFRPTIKRKRSTSSFQTSKKISSAIENDSQSVAPEKTKKATVKENILSKEEDSGKLVPNEEKSTPKSLLKDFDGHLLNEVKATLDCKPYTSVVSYDIMYKIEKLFRKLSL